jgi:2-hydroxy-3-oxopropionate reductase
MTTQALNIGFIGLGIMGTPMAEHLMRAGHQLFVFTHGKMPQFTGCGPAGRHHLHHGA